MIVAPEQGDIKIKTAQWMILLVERKELKQKKAQWIVPSAHAGGDSIFYVHTCHAPSKIIGAIPPWP